MKWFAMNLIESQMNSHNKRLSFSMSYCCSSEFTKCEKMTIQAFRLKFVLSLVETGCVGNTNEIQIYKSTLKPFDMKQKKKNTQNILVCVYCQRSQDFWVKHIDSHINWNVIKCCNIEWNSVWFDINHDRNDRKKAYLLNLTELVSTLICDRKIFGPICFAIVTRWTFI